LFTSPAAGDDGAEEPLPKWACSASLFSHAWPAPNAAALASFEQHTEAAAGPVTREGDISLPSMAMKHEELVESLQQGIDEARLAGVLGDHRLLLRAGFTLSGQLVWTLFGQADERLRFLHCGHTPAGSDVRGCILAAVRRHDETVGEGWERLRLAERWDIVAGQAERVRSLAVEAAWAEIPRYVQRLEERLQEYRLASCRELLRQRFPQFWAPEDDSPAVVDAVEWQRFWTDMGAERLDPPALSAHLDRATAEFLEAVVAAWPLHELVAALDAAPNHHVVVQVDDVLHSVPVAFLRHEGRFLFERVLSMHAVLSLSLVEWLRQVDRRVIQETLDEPDKILSLSWFTPDDHGPRNGAVLLHRGHQRLAPPLSGREWYSAADQPAGTHACLACGLRAHRAFRVASVCGHGNSDMAGIELGDGTWDGSSVLQKVEGSWQQRTACDISGIELLIQVSCSIGRVRQTGLQDVEGFCVELAVHRARSVLAGLWPLHALHAPEFANWVAGYYLRQRREAVREAETAFDSRDRERSQPCEGGESRTAAVASQLAGACLRAQAVAAARRQWLAEVRAGRGSIGLNTVAAFELYGLG